MDIFLSVGEGSMESLMELRVGKGGSMESLTLELGVGDGHGDWSPSPWSWSHGDVSKCW